MVKAKSRQGLVGYSVHVVAAALLLGVAACGQPGLGARARLPVSTADRIEVRQVFWDPDELQREAEEPPRPTPFGEGAIPVGSITEPDAVDQLATAVSEARYIDTGNMVIDLNNPDFEVLFFEGESLLARLGYYKDDVGPWGEHEVRGRWIEQGHWRLLALTTELPSHLMGEE